MKSTRPVRMMVIAGICLGGISACSPALIMNNPVSKTAEGWSITLSQVKEGPDEYIGEGGILVAAESGDKLVWTLVTVKNPGNEEQTFAYDNCFLEGNGVARRPVVVDRHANTEFNQAADRSEAIAPGKDVTRQVIYSFPEKQHPTRMTCEKVSLPIRARS